MIVRTTLATALAAAIFAMPVAAQDKPALTPGIVEQLNIASKLTDYGVERKDPLLLLAAARLIKEVTPEGVASTPPMGADALIARAKELSAGNAGIDALADTIASEGARGLCHGPGTVYGCF